MAKKKDNQQFKGKPSILLIEDEPALADIYATKLRSEGAEVTVAHDGVEGLAMALETLPNLILLDLVMPLKDGFSVLQDLKANRKTAEIPVIILSNLGQDFEIRRGQELGASCFLVKAATDPASLAKKVGQVLETGACPRPGVRNPQSS